jgi:hypothetical protein
MEPNLACDRQVCSWFASQNLRIKAKSEPTTIFSSLKPIQSAMRSLRLIWLIWQTDVVADFSEEISESWSKSKDKSLCCYHLGGPSALWRICFTPVTRIDIDGSHTLSLFLLTLMLMFPSSGEVIGELGPWVQPTTLNLCGSEEYA